MATRKIEDIWQQTYSGKRFYPFRDDSEGIDIDDIAHSLSMSCRFNGHTKYFYSVAEHSILVSNEIEKIYNDKELALCGLLHDTPESIISDIPRDIKHSGVCEDIIKLEDSIFKRMAKKFNLKYDYIPEKVKEIDNRILLDEGEQLLNYGIKDWYLFKQYKKLGLVLSCWEPRRAKRKFLEKFEDLTF